MEELSRPRGDVPFGWFSALLALLARRAARRRLLRQPPGRERPGPHLLPDDLHNLAAPR